MHGRKQMYKIYYQDRMTVRRLNYTSFYRLYT